MMFETCGRNLIKRLHAELILRTLAIVTGVPLFFIASSWSKCLQQSSPQWPLEL